MSWKETCAMDERLGLVGAYVAGEESISVLCRQYGISRKTGHKWLARYSLEGAAGLAERSSAPRRPGNAISAAVRSEILSLRRRHPHWGPRKLLARLMLERPGVSWPAASTVGDLLRREGLERPRRRRDPYPRYGGPFTRCTAPNDVWCADFKGWFATGSGLRCNPLTVTDAHSRYLLCCRHVDRPDVEHVRPIFEALFARHGLPRAILTDNGPPFASKGVLGLSELSVWWVKLGIRPQRIEPGKPQQNGRHERMHRTLKAETASPPAATIAGQQRRFERFLASYNDVRPHEALGQRVPSVVYRNSKRVYPGAAVEPLYPPAFAVRRLNAYGVLNWGGRQVLVGQALAGELVGLAETSTGNWLLRFADIDLGIIDRRTGKLDRRKEARPSLFTAA
jgi:putative transposase